MSNEHEKSSKKKKLLALLKDMDTKGSVKSSGIELVKTLAVSGFGLALGAWMGRPSLLAGAAATFAGYYYDSSKLTQMGVAMMTSGGYQLAQKGLTGTPTNGIEGVKERFKALKADMKHRLYLDKFTGSKDKSSDESTAGLGQVQYFKYPNNEVNMSGLDTIEEEITRSSEEYGRQMGASYEDIAGPQERIL